MTLSGLAVARPVTTVMLTLIAVLLGLVALLRIPVDLLPEIEAPALTIAVDYANASPQTMEELVTRLVERAVAATPGLEKILSVSAEGESNVTLYFAWGTDIDAAANDVRDALLSEADELPEEAERPQIFKFDSADIPILVLGIASRIDPVALRRIIDNHLLYRIQQVPGVAATEVWGGPQREIQVNLDYRQLLALELSLLDIEQALEAANGNQPAGSIFLGDREVTLRTPGRLESLAVLEGLTLAQVDGAPIALEQIADVADTVARQERLIRINGDPGVRMAVRKQSGANTVQVTERVLAEVARLNREYPQLEITPYFDTAGFIERSIANVSTALLYGSVLAVLVLLVFLGNPRATLVIATAIPVSLIATFALMFFNGYTINLMTLGGLALGVGMMVDCAIVVLENIVRRRDELGEAPAMAAVAGSNEIALAVVASTLTTLAIFIPMLFARELVGQLFRQLAIVVAFALLCSLLVALTLVPMLASRGGVAGVGHSGRLGSWVATRIEALQQAYRRGLEWALGHPRSVLGVTTLLLVAALAAIPLLGTEFMPGTDEGEVRVALEMPLGTKLDVMDRQARRVEAIVRREVPDALSVVADVGAVGYGASAGAQADIRIELPPADARSRSSAEVAADLREAIGALPATTVRVRTREPFFMRMLQGGRSEGESLAVEVRGYDFAVIDRLSAKVRDAVAGIDGVTDVRLPRSGGEPQRLILVDRARAADVGVSVAAVGRTVETAIAGVTAGYFLDDGDEVRILLKLAHNRQVSPEQILELPVPRAGGGTVRLGNVAHIEKARGPVLIERKNQQRLNTVYVNIAGRDLGSVAADVQAALATIPRPANYEMVVAGAYEEQVKTFRQMGINVALALLLVYMVIACLYESLRDPIIVMVSVPLALIGVVAMLLATNTTLNAQSLIGCLMLIGIVVNNAILIVDQANSLHRQGRSAREAAREAGRRRLRPILMTAATTILALIPLAIGAGEGGNVQAPLARAVIGGLLSSTLITLIVIPVVYTGFHRAWPPLRARAA